MRLEIHKHSEQLKKISKLSDKQLEISFTQILTKFKFINEAIIPVEIWLASEQITEGIDIDDTDFIDLTKFLRATLWTGDRALHNGLKKINFNKLINTTELLSLRTTKTGK